MKKMNCFLLVMIIFVNVINEISCIQELDLMETIFNGFELKETQKRIESFRADLKKSILDGVSQMPQSLKKIFIERAEKDNKKDWVSFRASEYLEFVETGNRINFETSNTNRKIQLINLVIGELITQNGTYIHQIMDGIWLICEESSWNTPAHIKELQAAGADLPDPEENTIDLRAGEMATTLSLIRLLLADSLSKLSPMTSKRIDYELYRRIVEPFLGRDDFFWMGFTPKGHINNHNSWNNANMLKMALLSLNDQKLRDAVIEKAIKSINKYVNAYPEDGGCDEGPLYWGYGPGKLIEFMDMFDSALPGQFNYTKYKQIFDRIGSYIYKVHIDGNRFMSFADSHGAWLPEAYRILKFGTLFNDDKMKKFAAYINNFKSKNQGEAILTSYHENGAFSNFVNELLSYSVLNSTEPKAPYPKEAWFPDIQVVALRSNEGTPKGLFFAAKGGNNDESHNHNDIGNFIVYVDGKPALIDIGVGQYTKQTFSEDRYDLWSMQSQFHNCPTINGVQQKDSAEYKATQVVFNATNYGGEFVENIANAYPKEADVKSWVRRWQFNGTNDSLKMTESYQLKSWKEPFAVHFMTCINGTHEKQGQIQLKYNQGPGLLIQFDENKFNVKFDEIPINDPVLLESWGPNVWRITLLSKDEKHSLEGSFEVDFKLIR